MTATTLKGVLASGTANFNADVDAEGNVTPYHLEDAGQRAALLTALGLLGTDAHLVQLLASLGGMADAETDIGAGSLIAVAKALRTSLATLASSDGSKATTALQTAGNTVLAQILTTLQAQRSETLWTDDTGATFVRLDVAGLISWTDLGGNPASAPGVGARPVAGPSAVVDRTAYQATAAAAGYSIGDFLDHIVVTDPATGAVIGHFWLNSTAEAKLAAAPAAANITPIAPLPAAASTSALQSAGNATLVTIAAALAGALTANATLQPSENHVGEVGGNSLVVAASFVRPANTTAYAVGQLVANNAAAASVTPLAVAIARKNGGTGLIRRVRVASSNPLALNTVFRVHFYKMLPTCSVGDGGTFAGGTNGVTAIHVGYSDVTLDRAFSDGAKGVGIPAVGSEIVFDTAAGSETIYALVEARAAYTPIASEAITVAVEALRD